MNSFKIMHTSSGPPAKDGVAIGLKCTRSGKQQRGVWATTMPNIAPLLTDVIPDVADANNSVRNTNKSAPVVEHAGLAVSGCG